MRNTLLAKKPLDRLLAEQGGNNRLRRVLGPVQLTSLGVGAIIGAGIFVMTGAIARQTAGPALVLSFAVVGVVCVFAALCYAEFASMVPVAGSAYTYAYATLGELFAWIIGWDLVLEYAVGAATVANGWSSYFQSALGIVHLELPAIIRGPVVSYDAASRHFTWTGSLVNLPAVLAVVLVTIVLVVGIRESARFNTLMVLVKVSAVALVIVVGATYVEPRNWHPFAPFGYSGVSLFGTTVLGQSDAGGPPRGMLAGAALAFFAFIGFDSVSTHAEESRHPQRDVPVGIVVSLLLCTVLYMAVVAVLTGMVPYDELDINAPVAEAFARVGLPWAHAVIAIAGVAGITSVLLVMMLSLPRVLLAMARDGLLPYNFFAAVHQRFHTPWKSTLVTGAFVAALAAFLPIDTLVRLVNMGTLLAFLIVCAAVLIMRRTHPDAARPFRAPFGWLVPVLGIVSCALLMFSLPSENWLRLFAWLAIGLVIYGCYGHRHSALRACSRHDKPESRALMGSASPASQPEPPP